MKLVKCISCKGKKQNQPLKIGKIYEGTSNIQLQTIAKLEQERFK